MNNACLSYYSVICLSCYSVICSEREREGGGGREREREREREESTPALKVMVMGRVIASIVHACQLLAVWVGGIDSVGQQTLM